MTEIVMPERPIVVEEEEKVGRYGLAVAIVGTVLVLVDGITVLAMNSVISPSFGGALVVGSSEIVLSLLSLIALYFYADHSTPVAWAVGILSVIAFLFDGGFFYFGATMALYGAIVIYFWK